MCMLDKIRSLIFLSLCASLETTKHAKTREFRLYWWDPVCKVNELCLVDCFHRKFKVSTQIMVCNYCIAKCQKFSAYDGLLMARLIFSGI